ncbi:MAG: ABC transporter substrate-binding protein [Cytophagaceae bacterium]|jgi:nitrate/nitrite transport system substrate-binding protein|nr:ABC transporter substrate-binding protein [Cytophagaceae bacterium]
MKKMLRKIAVVTGIGTALLILPSAQKSMQQEDVIKIGFIPLTDCAPIVMAKEYGLFKKQGVNVVVTKEASWANVRDKLLTGELQAAHCLSSMPLSVYTGVGGKAGSELKIAMILNTNGQAITLSNEFCGKIGFKQVNKVKGVVDARKASGKEVTFAMTFPGGTHDMWLRNWLANAGINQKSVKIITIPPPQMVANMKVGNMDGFCVGEPWNGVAVAQTVGFTHLATQDIWKHHPEKALVVNKAFAEGKRDQLKKVMKAVMEACKLLDNGANRKQSATVIGAPSYVNAAPAVIENRLAGIYDLGCNQGQVTYVDDYMLFHKKGLVNFPRRSHMYWYLAQYVRFGYLSEEPNYKEVVDKLLMQDLYKEVATEMGVAIPNDDMTPFATNIEPGATFDPKNPSAYLSTCKK